MFTEFVYAKKGSGMIYTELQYCPSTLGQWYWGGPGNINLLIQPLQYSLGGCFTMSMCSFCNKISFQSKKPSTVL